MYTEGRPSDDTSSWARRLRSLQKATQNAAVAHSISTRGPILGTSRHRHLAPAAAVREVPAATTGGSESSGTSSPLPPEWKDIDAYFDQRASQEKKKKQGRGEQLSSPPEPYEGDGLPPSLVDAYLGALPKAESAEETDPPHLSGTARRSPAGITRSSEPNKVDKSTSPDRTPEAASTCWSQRYIGNQRLQSPQIPYALLLDSMQQHFKNEAPPKPVSQAPRQTLQISISRHREEEDSLPPLQQKKKQRADESEASIQEQSYHSRRAVSLYELRLAASGHSMMYTPQWGNTAVIAQNKGKPKEESPRRLQDTSPLRHKSSSSPLLYTTTTTTTTAIRSGSAEERPKGGNTASPGGREQNEHESTTAEVLPLQTEKNTKYSRQSPHRSRSKEGKDEEKMYTPCNIEAHLPVIGEARGAAHTTREASVQVSSPPTGGGRSRRVMPSRPTATDSVEDASTAERKRKESMAIEKCQELVRDIEKTLTPVPETSLYPLVLKGTSAKDESLRSNNKNNEHDNDPEVNSPCSSPSAAVAMQAPIHYKIRDKEGEDDEASLLTCDTIADKGEEREGLPSFHAEISVQTDDTFVSYLPQPKKSSSANKPNQEETNTEMLALAQQRRPMVNLHDVVRLQGAALGDAVVNFCQWRDLYFEKRKNRNDSSH